MADKTEISWADKTWSPWEGCTKVSPGCDSCYAESMNRWLRKGLNWGPNAPRRVYSEEHWEQPLRWQRRLAKAGMRATVFPSVCDPFDTKYPQGHRRRFAQLILATPNLTWLLLTKRIGNAAAVLAEMFPAGVPANVRIGATFVAQEEVDRDIDKLRALPYPNFASFEPLLGRVTIPKLCDAGSVPGPGGAGGVMCSRCDGNQHYGCLGLDWVIAGGESGRKARPANPDWFRSLRDQCAAAGVPFHFKQWGEWADGFEGPGGEWRAVQWLTGDASTRVGKKLSGRLLDGVEHNDFPEVAW